MKFGFGKSMEYLVEVYDISSPTNWNEQIYIIYQYTSRTVLAFLSTT
jgi:hypothetical protein